jgi:hypothetical protein
MGHLGLSYGTLATSADALIIACVWLLYEARKMGERHKRTVDFVMDRGLLDEFVKEVRPKD